MIVHKRGKGIVRHKCNHKYIKRTGSGFFDFLKPVINIVKGVMGHKDTISKVFNTGKDLYKVGQNTKDIIQSIRKPKHVVQTKPAIDTNLENIISRINGLKVGTGTRRRSTGKGFAYA